MGSTPAPLHTYFSLPLHTQLACAAPGFAWLTRVALFTHTRLLYAAAGGALHAARALALFSGGFEQVRAGVGGDYWCVHGTRRSAALTCSHLNMAFLTGGRAAAGQKVVI